MTALTDFLLSGHNWFEADCLEITLPNGYVIRSTSHQTDIVLSGHTFYATKFGKWERGDTTQEPAKGTTETEVKMLCDPSILFPYAAITPMFQRAKLFSRSAITITTVYMDAGGTIQGSSIVFTGVMNVPVTETTLVTFTCSDNLYRCLAPWPARKFQAGCPFAVFDAHCRLDRASFAVTRAVLSGSTAASTHVSALGSVGTDTLPYTKGYIVPTSGEAQGFSITVLSQPDTTHIQLAPFDIPLAVGDTFTLYPGCDQKVSTCQSKFNNLVHFGGFPYIPQPEKAANG